MTQNIFQTGMDVAAGMQGLRAEDQRQQVIDQNSQYVAEDRQLAADNRMMQQQATDQLNQLKQAYGETGDPSVMRQIIMADPTFAGQIQQQFGIIDEASKSQSLNEAATLKQMLETQPDQAMAYWQQNLAQNPAFAELADNFQAGDIKGALNEIGFGVTAIGGQEAYDSLFAVEEVAEPELPSSVREWEYYNSLSDEQKQQYLNMKRSNQLYKQGDVTMMVDQVGGGGEVITEQGEEPSSQADAQANLTEQEAIKAASVKAAEQAIAMSREAFTSLEGVRAAIPNLDEAIRLVDEGANTGLIMSRLPSVQQASLELDNLQGRLGLDVIGNTTFGALSEAELKFALDTALPKSLDGPALKEWLQRKKESQTKLSQYLEDAAIFLGTPGNTAADFLKQQKSSASLESMSDDDLMNF